MNKAQKKRYVKVWRGNHSPVGLMEMIAKTPAHNVAEAICRAEAENLSPVEVATLAAKGWQGK